MATVDDFVLIFPEFASRDAAQLARVLALVDSRISDTFGDSIDEVIYWEMADSLAAGGKGRQARRGSGDMQSSYAAKLKELTEAHAVGRRVVDE